MKARWVLIPVVVGALAVAGYSTFSAAQPPFDFISKFKGERIPYPWNDKPTPDVRREDCYGFKADVRSMQTALQREMRQRGWEPMNSCFGGEDSYSELTMSTPGGIDWEANYGRVTLWYAPSTPKGYTCVAIVRNGDSWLDRRWRKLRKWIGHKSTSEE